MALDASHSTDLEWEMGDSSASVLSAVSGEPHLDALSAILNDRGFRRRVIVPGRGRPSFLHLINIEVAGLAEDVGCVEAPEDGEHWFTWSWGDRIGPEPDVERVAEVVARVLSPER